MSDVATLRVELKTWEREFKTVHGHEPSVHDIKAQPVVAEKYRLYKRLSKFAAAVSSSSLTGVRHGTAASTGSSTPPPPSTPPRTRQHVAHQGGVPTTSGASLLLKSRAVATAPSGSSLNPFSPVKRDARPAPAHAVVHQYADANPFASPPNHKTDSTSRGSFRAPSPTALPVIHDMLFSHTTAASAPSAAASQSNRNIVRARKRLRGEPVSPSPSKDKRRRVLSNAKIPPFPQLDLVQRSGADTRDDAFIEDSPVKTSRPDSARMFQTLFDEDMLPSPDFAQAKMRRLGSSDSVFGDDASSGAGDEPPPTDFEDFAVDPASPDSRSISEKTTRPSRTIVAGARLPGVTNLRAADPRDADAVAQDRSTDPLDTTRAPSSAPSADEGNANSRLERDASSNGLMPPSPPSATVKSKKPSYRPGAASSAKSKGKQKPPNASARSSSKRARASVSAAADDDESGHDEGAESEELGVREYDWNASRRAYGGADPRSDFDPEFDFALGRKPLVVNPPFEEDEDEGRFEINLPDHLRRVLALSPTAIAASATTDGDGAVGRAGSRTRSRRPEDAISRAIVTGTRLGHYDSGRGGEIWDVGEISDDEEAAPAPQTGESGDDDWEAEGVPWEVGEL